MVVAEPSEAVHQGVPDAAGRRDVHAVAGVAVQVGEVDEDALHEGLERAVLVADLSGDDRLDDGGQRRVAGRDRVVVLVVGALLLRRERFTCEEERKDRVSLLEYLEPVDHQRVVMQQQWQP